MQEPVFDALIAGFYRAASGALGWPEALAKAQTALSALAIHLHGIDLSEGRVVFSHVGGESSPEAELDYVRTFHRTDPRGALIASEPTGRWFNCWEHFDEAYVATNPFYQDFLIPYGLRYVSGVKVFEEDGLSVLLGFHRGVGQAPFNGPEIEACRRLAWHLGQAFLLYRADLKSRRTNRLGTELLERMQTPLVLMDEERNILLANPPAKALLQASTVIETRGGRLHCRSPKEDAELLVAVLKMLRDEQVPPESAAVDRIFLRAASPAGDGSLGLHLHALRPAETLQAFDERPLVLLVLHESGKPLDRDPFLVASAFDLTPAEAKVAIEIARGRSVEEIAQANTVAVSTVRTQLRQVFHKTGAVRQTQLVAMLAGLPAF